MDKNRADIRSERFADWLMRFSPRRALDVGCDTGSLVGALRARGVEAFGVDTNSGAFRPELKEALFPFDVGEGTLRFVDQSLDLVTAIGCLDYVRGYAHALDEIRRVSAAGAHLVMTFAIDTRLRSEARPNVFKTETWERELSARGFEPDHELARKWERETIDHPSSGLSRILPTSALLLRRRTSGMPFGCVVAQRLPAPRG